MPIITAAVGLIIGVIIGFLYRKTQESAMTTSLNASIVQLQTELKSKAEVQSLMSQQFENLAQKIFEEKSVKFADQNQKSISSLVDPIRVQLKEFEKKVDEVYSSERVERGVLKSELGRLMELNQIMSSDAKNLTKALKGDNKTQGNWGELILENILEKSGLRKDQEYFVQATLKGEEGQILRPDVIVQLPDQKHLIVDSKMTLNAYEQYSSAETSESQDLFAKAHVDSLKKHIDGLSEKKYNLSETLVTPDFVILFMPLEPAFALAFKIKPEIFNYAWERGIAIVSPTTLLVTLRTVAALWKQDRQEKNALEIAKRGGLLYDKFVGLVKDMQTVGERITQAGSAHTDMMKKISEGKGNLVDQVEDLKRLGAKTEKALPQISAE